MFKVICNVEKKSLPLHSDKPILTYNNCQPCATLHYKLTASSAPFNSKAISATIKSNNNHGLNPENPRYAHVYEKVSEFNDLSDFRYVAFFEDNPLLENAFIKSEQYNVFPLSESIIDLSGTPIWGKTNYLTFSNPPSFQPGVLKKDGDIGDLIYHMDEFFLNFLESKNLLECDSVVETHDNHNLSIYNDYLSNLQNYLQDQIRASLAKYKTCNIKGVDTLIVHSGPSKEEQLSNLCQNLGGYLKTDEELIEELICQDKEADFKLIGNEAYNITCGQYQNNQFKSISLQEMHVIL